MKKYLFILALTFAVYLAYSQDTADSYKIMFYNVENLFDTQDDPLVKDEEFLPEGDRFWNKYKYYSKLNNIYKVIVAVGGWNPPAIIGLCEIENRKVIEDLVSDTPLNKYNYQIVHKDSPDRRGIDVGLLYRKELFTPLSYEAIPINFPDKPEYKTRDILYVKGITNNSDTLNIFINHWPSRWGGQLESEDRRVFVASVLKEKVDSIFKSNPKSNIIITGDFNDYPDNKSINEVLAASQSFDKITDNKLYNLSSYFYKTKNIGSNKYQGEWGVLDQVIVSGNILNKSNSVYTSKEDIYIFNADFLLEPDNSHFGYMPKRTFIGYKYNGGFSDHLPTYLILNFNK
jgi:predicted extracellular nuclease